MGAFGLIALTLTVTPTVELWGQVDHAPPRPGWVYAKRGQSVLLHAFVKGAQPRSFRWLRLEPTASAVDNTQPHFHFAAIAYRATELSACRDQPTCPADVTATMLPRVPGLSGVGTMAFQVEVETASGRAATPGVESVLSGGLAPNVMRVTFRRDDSYVGYLAELINTPYIFGSAGGPGKNQSDLLIGSDCADLAIYGRRRMGAAAQYTSSYAIDQQAHLNGTATSLDEHQIALDAKHRPIAFGATGVKVGDLLHFPSSRHVGVLYEDREPLGVLDENDLMLHTCWAPPTVEPIGHSTCASLPWRLLRF